MTRRITHASLFSGIGGFDLAARWMGWQNVFHCEIDPFCQRVLAHHFPESTPHGDINQTDFTPYADRIDILSGGFPCQPFSTAGKRLGTADERHLWPAMLGAIRTIRPCYVVGENVSGILNWNGGLVFEQVCAELEAEGYQVLPFVLPAGGVGAPHRRDRVWFIAHRIVNAAHPDSTGLEGGQLGCPRREGCRAEALGSTAQRAQIPTWDNWPVERPICGKYDGFSGRLAGITFPRWRNESLKALGNAIVPAVAYQIFQTIQECEIVSFENPKPHETRTD